MKNREGFYFFPKRRKGNEKMGKCLIFIKRIKQSETDVTEFWKRVEEGEEERERKRE